MKKLIMIVCLCICTCIPCLGSGPSGTTTNSIWVTVLDRNNQPIPNMSVTLISYVTRYSRGNTVEKKPNTLQKTDVSGKAFFNTENISTSGTASFLLKSSALGYNNKEYSEIPNSGHNEITFRINVDVSSESKDITADSAGWI